MKREEIQQQSYIDWLKSIGCIFYAPLNGNSRTEDIIGGITGVVNPNYGTCVYDSIEDAYHVSKQNTYLSISWRGVNQFANLSFDDYFSPFTMCVTTKYTGSAYNSWANIARIGGNPNTGECYNQIAAGTTTLQYYEPVSKDIYHKLVTQVDSSNNLYFKIDGVSKTVMQNPWKLMNTYRQNNLCVSGEYGMDWYVKNFYFFNTFLTDEKISNLL